MAVDSEPCQGRIADMSEANQGLIAINLSDLEAETRCPVCLGVIKNARLVSGCMHRFCAECIEKWLRVCRENNCPQCRMPMQSRRDCKKDGKYDRLLRLLYADIEKYETEMLDADDAILEQAMQTGAALKRARDNQKAARKPKVEVLQPAGNARSGSTSPRKVHWDGQQGQGVFVEPQGPKGPYRSIMVGQSQLPTKPFAELKPELQDVPSDWSHPDESRSEEGQAELSSSSGHLREQPQGQMPTASQEPQAQRWLSLKPRSAENDQGTRRDMDTDSGTDKQQPQPGKQRSGRPGQPQTASSRPPSHGPIGSPVAKMVPLSSLEPKACAPQGSAQRATPMGAASFPVGGTTGTVGRGWPGQFGAMPSQSGSGVNTGESKGTKRAGGDGESKGKKRQRRSVQEKSTDGEGRQSTGPIAAFLRPLPPSQPESEAKAQAASLAATAAAAAQQQDVISHGVVQICMMPATDVDEGRALPALDKPFLKCPANMQVHELQKVVANKMQHAVHNKPDSVQLKIADDGSSQKALPQQTLAELSNVQKELKQHVVLHYHLQL